MCRIPLRSGVVRLATAGLFVALAACTSTPESTEPPPAPAPPSPVANEAPGAGGETKAFDPSGCRPPETTTGPLVVRGGPDGACTLITADDDYAYEFVNVADGGTLYFQDDGRAIDFRAKSILVEMGGTVRAGSWDEPFGAKGGSLTIGLWGDDPTAEGTRRPASEPGIRCIGGQGETGCYPEDRVDRFCLGTDPDDPCTAREAGAIGDNARFEGYRDLEYDEGFFGYKVLAVSYGGRLELFGRRGVVPNASDPTARVEHPTCAPPGPDLHATEATGSSWARLAAPIGPGTTRLELDHPVDWAEGDRVALATTDWYPSHSEVVTVADNANGVVTLQAPPRFEHRGDVFTMPAQAMAGTGNPNTAVDVRGAAGLLTRSITIRSLGRTADEPFPDAGRCGMEADDPGCYFGGHVIVRQGFGAFHVQGVAFHQLGQGGRMGHYPLHFHLNKSTRYTNAFVTDSAITESHNRFVVLHGTHDVTLARNVGYLSVGHGFFLEDGSEINNLLCYNLGISARGALEEYYRAQPPDSPTHRAVPPILDKIQGGTGTAGSDGHMPVMFWIMNAYNEFVGNKAVGVMGAGSCYWLLGSGVSGMSAPGHMAGMGAVRWTSGTNTDQDYAAFNRAGARQAPLKRFRANSCATAAYALQTTIDVEPTQPVNTGFHALANPYLKVEDIMRPMVSGNFNPTRVDDPALAALPGRPEPNCRQGIATGDSWALNGPSCSGTVIDRFTTSFNWAEVGFGSVWLRPWWYVFVNSAITDQLFGGLGFVTGGSWAQVPPGNLQIARDSLFVGTTSGGDPAGYHGPDVTRAVRSGPALTLPAEGIGYPTGSLNPQRLMTIYDGPFYSDGSAFAAVAPFDCPEGDLARCGVYTFTMQPKKAGTPPQMTVVNAAIGWKQQNGFYYPPAFAFRRSGFDAASFRHNTFDQYAPYAGGDPFGLVTSIDFSTILNDLDGTLTGVVSSRGPRSASISRNKFFDAPSQDDECLSFGVQTSPYDFVTTAMAKLQGDGPWTVDWQAWNTPTVNPAVPIYRQLKLASDVCDGDTTCGCWRASFLMGGQNGEAPYLTADRGVYYVDTTMTSKPSCGAGENRLLPVNSHLAPFRDGETYVLYHLFARPDTRVTYQLFVGDGFRPTDGRWVRVQPHVFSGGGNNLLVTADDGIAAPLPAAVNGVLTVTLDNAQIGADFAFTARADDEKCHPRDLCQIAADGGGCTIAERYAESDLADAIRSICEEWATVTAGVADTMDGLTLADCPEGGCLGYAFTMPSGFEASRAGHPYTVAGLPLATWFPDDADWNVPMRLLPGENPCPAPPPPSGFGGQ
ncbi:MAG: G8 domain-containing protein [Ardenticatenales bacterium]|nr:G8 domain-containing protein [Ardenticatenales bacterium]